MSSYIAAYSPMRPGGDEARRQRARRVGTVARAGDRPGDERHAASAITGRARVRAAGDRCGERSRARRDARPDIVFTVDPAGSMHVAER